jgi:hypothetical protein
MSETPPVLPSLRSRAGRRFEAIRELELEPAAVDAAASLPGAHRGVVVLREMAGPFGVPDLVAVVGPPTRLDDRLALAVPPLLNQIDAGVVAAAAPRARRSAETLARRAGFALHSVERRVTELTRVGALIRTGPNSYVRPEALQTVGRLYAIETKVKDWRRALQQARTYSLWCDSYVLVLASLGSASQATVLDAVVGDGAGLVVAGRWLRRPRLGERSPAQRLWGSEHLVAAMRGED